MEYEEIIGLIRRASGSLDREEAARSAQATLETLAERLPPGEAEDLLRELPAEMRPWLYTETDAAPYGIDEFLQRVAELEGTELESALLAARAVFFALGDAMSAEALAHLADSLPQSFDPLLAEAQHRYLDIMPADEFWAWVSQRLGDDESPARLVSGAVLETLAERIAAGQVEDLIAQLDPLLHPPLRRGIAAEPSARLMTPEEFLRRVAAREGGDPDEAGILDQLARHVRAVLATLSDAVSTKEWREVVVQLPEDYRVLIPARSV
jgi:uncharacterized protein (DUF2267 family)